MTTRILDNQLSFGQALFFFFTPKRVSDAQIACNSSRFNYHWKHPLFSTFASVMVIVNGIIGMNDIGHA